MTVVTSEGVAGSMCCITQSVEVGMQGQLCRVHGTLLVISGTSYIAKHQHCAPKSPYLTILDLTYLSYSDYHQGA